MNEINNHRNNEKKEREREKKDKVPSPLRWFFIHSFIHEHKYYNMITNSSQQKKIFDTRKKIVNNYELVYYCSKQKKGEVIVHWKCS